MRLLVQVLTSVLLLLATIPALAQYSIDKVIFNSTTPYTEAELLSVSGLQPGQFLSHDSLANAAQHLLDTGLFSDAEIHLSGDGKARTVHVDPKPIPLEKLLPTSFENFVWFTPAELTAGIHARVPLYRGVASDAGNLPDSIQSALQQMLAEKGVTATLSHTILEPTNQHPVRVIDFTVDQPGIRLGGVHLSMVAPPGAAAALTPGLQQAANHATRSPYDEGLANLTLEDLLLAPIRDAGYINAILDNTQRTVAPSPTDAHTLIVTYTARIVTGDAYKVSAVTWQPTPLYSANDFARDAKLHSGDLANAAALAESEAAISTTYLAHGYQDVYLLSHPVTDDTAHIVAYTLEPIPGEIYHFHTVTPTGLSAEALTEFNSAWRMKPGDVYNPSYVSEFIHTNTALPHLSTYTGAFQASADPQTHLVDLTLTFYPSGGR